MSADKDAKLKALKLTMDRMDKAYGKGTVMKMGDAPVIEVESIPTGSLTLDIALGVGGYPMGRVVEIYGPESSGKTTLTLHAIAECQRKGGIAAFIDAEHAFDRFYAEKLGIDIDNLIISQPDNGEQALEIAESIDDKKSIGLIYSKKGNLQLIIEELDKAIVSVNKAIEMQRFSKDNANLGNSYKTFGDIYKSKKNYKQAIDYYISAQTLFEQEGLNNNLAEVLLSEAQTYIELKNYNKARTIIEQSVALSKRLELPKIQSGALINHGKVYNLLGDNDKAMHYAFEGLKIAKKNNFADILNDGYLVLSDIAQSLGDYKLSIEYLKAHLKLSDSLRAIKRENLSPEKKIQSLINDQIANNKKQEAQLKEANSKNDLSTLISILSCKNTYLKKKIRIEIKYVFLKS